MKIAYLLNTYPMTSTTFIRREIEALTSAGVEVHRFAARRWAQALVDPLDQAEETRTHYLLDAGAVRLFAGFVRELVANPAGTARAIAVCISLYRAGGGFVRHAAYLLQAAYFKRNARTAQIEHVHAHFATNATAVALLSHVMGGPGYSFTAHGPDEFENTARLSYDQKVGHARFVAAITHYCRVQLVRASGWTHWNKIEIVRCGLKIEDFEPTEAFDDVGQVFVCVARIDSQKGLLLLPATLAILKPEFPRLRVVVIGDGLERPALEAALAKHGVAHMVELRGWQTGREVIAALGRCRALLLPSFAEGLPIVIMEAFALGRPVIASHIAGIPELVDRECGWLVPPGDIEALARAMRAAANATSRTLAAMGAEGRRRTLAMHDVAHSAAALKARFESSASSLT